MFVDEVNCSLYPEVLLNGLSQNPVEDDGEAVAELWYEFGVGVRYCELYTLVLVLIRF